MNVERLQQAIEIIKAVPDTQFDLETWQQGIDGRLTNSCRLVDTLDCRTLACAGGWLALHPDMQAQGLYVGIGGEPAILRQVKVFQENRYENIPTYGFSALAEFFDTTIATAEYLFGQRIRLEILRDPRSDKEVWLDRAETLIANFQGKI